MFESQKTGLGDSVGDKIVFQKYVLINIRFKFAFMGFIVLSNFMVFYGFVCLFGLNILNEINFVKSVEG